MLPNMNADQRILQILENSACLSKGQLLGYLKHNLYPEELRAVELHLSTCALCNDALDGLELQQDPDQLLASLVPPVLPAIVVAPKEKPKEKKEIPTVAPVAASKAPHATAGESHAIQHFKPRKLWLRPLGIAAALALGFGALWYFEFRKEDEPVLARRTAENAIPANENTGDTGNRPMAAAAPVPDNVLPEAEAEQKHKDSLLLAKREEARRKARKDSLALAAQKTAQSSEESQGLLAKQASAEKESTAVADVEAKKPMAAPAVAARSKEESSKEDNKEPKKAPTDFEQGMQKYKEKNYASALLYFKSAESDKSDPKHWEAVYYSALCNKNLDKKRRAIKLLERVIEANAPQKKAAQKQLDELQKKDK